jgi:molybdate transport system regulatory protein
MPRLTIRIDFDDGSALGPGKVKLLELVAETGSIRKAAAGMKMSYRKAWLLLQALKKTFGESLVVTSRGGKAGGGARLTRLGQFIVGRYRALEEAARHSGKPDIEALNGKIRTSARKKSRLRHGIRA